MDQVDLLGNVVSVEDPGGFGSTQSSVEALEAYYTGTERGDNASTHGGIHVDPMVSTVLIDHEAEDTIFATHRHCEMSCKQCCEWKRILRS